MLLCVYGVDRVSDDRLGKSTASWNYMFEHMLTERASEASVKYASILREILLAARASR